MNTRLLIQDLAHRLPYHLKGILQDGHDIEVELVGMDLSKPENPILSVSVPGFKSPWNCSPSLFKPLLFPFPRIYTDLGGGVIPWVEFEKRRELDGLSNEEKEKVHEVVGVEFTESSGGKFMFYELTRKIKESGETYTYSGTATFNHHLAFQVAYELGIDVSGLIDLGLAISKGDENKSSE